MKNPDASFRLLACSYVKKQANTLLSHVDGIRGGDDIESVHQARVASRRICTALGVFGAAFPTGKVRQWKKHIRRLIKGLGLARDKDVQIEFVDGMVADRTLAKGADLPGLKRLLLRLRQQREAIQPRVIKSVDRLDATGILSDILARTSKSISRLRKAGTDLSSPFVLESGARVIRKTCNKLLRLQSCLEDAGAIEQHHQMRIAAKRLRYTMEIYKKVFGKRLNETIKVVRGVQTLLGDIHDCDVWCEFIQAFSQEEQQRTVEYFGHARTFRRFQPGFDYLRDERITHRRETFNELVALWKDLEKGRFWEELIACLEAPYAERVPDHAAIQTEEPAPEIEESPVSHNAEETGLTHTESSQVESPEIRDEGKDDTSSSILAPDQEELESYTSTNEESEAGIDEAVPSAPDRPDISNALSTENVLCECCGKNGFLQDELLRIDSGQRLCPGCLGELHEKAAFMTKRSRLR